MKRIIVSQTNAGSTSAIPLDPNKSPFNVGFAAVVTSGSPTMTVQHTFDNIYDSTVTPTWFNHPYVNAVTVSTDGNYAYPVAAVRLTVTGTGVGTLTILQGVI